MIFEHLEESLAEIRNLMATGQHAEARELATTQVCNLRRSWGYCGKRRHEQDYIRAFNRLRAECARKLSGMTSEIDI